VLITVPKFIQERFGDDAHQRWLSGLSAQAHEVYAKPILSSLWYPIIPCLAEPTVVVCDLFYGRDLKGAWESGRYTAEVALSGVYKIFAIVGSPQTILKKGCAAMSMLYRDSEIAMTEVQEKRATLTVTKFPEPHPALEMRLGGFIERSLEICKCKGVSVKLGRRMTQGDAVTECLISWA
jgi:hypothetical protein